MRGSICLSPSYFWRKGSWNRLDGPRIAPARALLWQPQHGMLLGPGSWREESAASRRERALTATTVRESAFWKQLDGKSVL